MGRGLAPSLELLHTLARTTKVSPNQVSHSSGEKKKKRPPLRRLDRHGKTHCDADRREGIRTLDNRKNSTDVKITAPRACFCKGIYYISSKLLSRRTARRIRWLQGHGDNKRGLQYMGSSSAAMLDVHMRKADHPRVIASYNPLATWFVRCFAGGVRRSDYPTIHPSTPLGSFCMAMIGLRVALARGIDYQSPSRKPKATRYAEPLPTRVKVLKLHIYQTFSTMSTFHIHFNVERSRTGSGTHPNPPPPRKDRIKQPWAASHQPARSSSQP